MTAFRAGAARPDADRPGTDIPGTDIGGATNPMAVINALGTKRPPAPTSGCDGSRQSIPCQYITSPPFGDSVAPT
jgi:hypothetical protein